MKFELEPIGVVESKFKERYETPHQGILNSDELSLINLIPHRNYEQALKDIEGFTKIWVIYLFHLNSTWKPLVTPPRHNGKKVGVFASRSPHRPNNIGLSCVTLVRVEGLKIYISNSDILDGSPVLDIKPYLPYSDSFPDSQTGWVKTAEKEKYKISFSPEATENCSDILMDSGENIRGYAEVQLIMDPADTNRKRITRIEDGDYELVYQNWSIVYSINDEMKEVKVGKIRIRS